MKVGQVVGYVFHGEILRAEIIRVISEVERMVDLTVYSGSPPVGRPHGCVKAAENKRHNTWHEVA